MLKTLNGGSDVFGQRNKIFAERVAVLGIKSATRPNGADAEDGPRTFNENRRCNAGNSHLDFFHAFSEPTFSDLQKLFAQALLRGPGLAGIGFHFTLQDAFTVTFVSKRRNRLGARASVHRPD